MFLELKFSQIMATVSSLKNWPLFIQHLLSNNGKIISLMQIQHMLHLMAAVIICHGRYW